jgi:hypothetical protein
MEKIISDMKKYIQLCLIVSVAFWASGFGCGKGKSNSEAVSPTGKGGSLARFNIVNDYLYVLSGNEIRTFAIESPGTLSAKGSTDAGMSPETMFSLNDQLYLGSPTSMSIYTLANPAQPKFQGMASHIRSCDPVVSDGQFAYVTLNATNFCGGSNVLNVYDVQNPYFPQLVSSFNMTAPRGLAISETHLYVCDEGIKIYDRLNQGQPQFLEHIKGIPAQDLIISQNRLHVMRKEGITQYQISGDKINWLSTIGL